MDIWIVEHKTLYTTGLESGVRRGIGTGIQEFNIDLFISIRKDEALKHAWKIAQSKIKDVEYNENGNYVNISSSGNKWPDDTIKITHKFLGFIQFPAIEYNIKDL